MDEEEKEGKGNKGEEVDGLGRGEPRGGEGERGRCDNGGRANDGREIRLHEAIRRGWIEKYTGGTGDVVGLSAPPEERGNEERA